MSRQCVILAFFFFTDTATTEIYTLSLHDALPIFQHRGNLPREACLEADADVCVEAHARRDRRGRAGRALDRKSTRLNSSHVSISYAVFCLKKKNNEIHDTARELASRSSGSWIGH